VKKAYFLWPMAALFLFCSGSALGLIDINSVSQSELEELPGIGPGYAKKIIEGRPYRNINELTRIKGISGKTFDKFKDMISAGRGDQKKAQKEPRKITVYSVEQYKSIKCPLCNNEYQTSSELVTGWCPYCGMKWRARKAADTAGSSPFTPEAADAISFQEAGKYVDQTKTVKGTITGAHVSPGSGNLYLNFHDNYRMYLSVKIPADAIDKFRSDAESYYIGKKVAATGTIVKEEDAKYLRQIVTDPNNLKVEE